MTRKAYLYFVLTFVYGVIAGAGGLLVYSWYSGHWTRRFHRPDPREIAQRMTRDLDLTPDQTRQLTDIINDSFQKHRVLDQQVGQEYQALRTDTRARIRKILNPAQQEKFDELARRFEQRRQQPPPGPPH